MPYDDAGLRSEGNVNARSPLHKVTKRIGATAGSKRSLETGQIPPRWPNLVTRTNGVESWPSATANGTE